MGKKTNGQHVIQLFERLFPKHLAMEGDKIGLQVGSLSKPVHRVLIALDVTPQVVEEAIEKKIDLIISHHPIIFMPLKSMTTDSTYGKMLENCIKYNIAIYAAHTNVDVAKGGVNDLLAEALELKETEVLVSTYEEKMKKLVVFVPITHVEQVKEAISQGGAGHIGNYSHCSFSVEGKGNFKPLEGANPYIGHQGVIEIVEEVRVETIMKSSEQKRIIQAMIKAHPYEEVAYDVYALEMPGEELGLGKIGKLPQEMSLGEFAEYVKRKLDVPTLRVVGDLGNKVKKVAVLGGDGNKYFRSAKFKGADVYVTGDIYYHVAHDALLEGMNIVDPGHNVEKVMKKGVQQMLQDQVNQQDLDVEIMASDIHTDPFTFI